MWVKLHLWLYTSTVMKNSYIELVLFCSTLLLLVCIKLWSMWHYGVSMELECFLPYGGLQHLTYILISIVHKSSFHVSVCCVLRLPSGKCNSIWHCAIVVGLLLDWSLINIFHVILVAQSGLRSSPGAMKPWEVFW